MRMTIITEYTQRKMTIISVSQVKSLATLIFISSQLSEMFFHASKIGVVGKKSHIKAPCGNKKFLCLVQSDDSLEFITQTLCPEDVYCYCTELFVAYLGQ